MDGDVGLGGRDGVRGRDGRREEIREGMNEGEGRGGRRREEMK